MPKQSLTKRAARLVKDIEAGKDIDLRDRWKKISEDEGVPGLVQCVEELGPMPEASLDDVPLPRAITYAARDADATLRLYPTMRARCEEMDLSLVEAIDLGAIPMIERMQRVGIKIDKEHFHKVERDMAAGAAAQVAAIKDLTGELINPESGDQVAWLLFDKLHLTPLMMTKSKTRPSTNDKTLESLRFAHPVVPHILDYREMDGLRALSRKLPRMAGADGRIHCTLRVTRVPSGRLAASNPPLMAQPVSTDLGLEIRKGYIAERGHVFGEWDLSQIEMCVMAHLSKDEKLVHMFREGQDVHEQTAMWMFGIKNAADVDKMKHRYPAKRVGFGVVNGISAKGLHEQYMLVNLFDYNESDCDGQIKEWFRIYRGVKNYLEEVKASARRYGLVRDMWGRVRYTPGIHSEQSWVRETAEREATNHMIQGGAQGIIKLAMGSIWRDILPRYRAESVYVEPLLQIHDSLLFELEDGAQDLLGPEIHDAMCDAGSGMIVPVRAEHGFGLNWGVIDK